MNIYIISYLISLPIIFLLHFYLKRRRDNMNYTIETLKLEIELLKNSTTLFKTEFKRKINIIQEEVNKTENKEFIEKEVKMENSGRLGTPACFTSFEYLK